MPAHSWIRCGLITDVLDSLLKLCGCVVAAEVVLELN